MPEMVVIFSCHSLRFSISLKYSARTEKSPQPGHQVGWSAAISFLVSGLRSVAARRRRPGSRLAGAVAVVRRVRFSSRSCAHKSVNRLEKAVTACGCPAANVRAGAVEDFFHFPGQAVGLVDAADPGVAEAGAQQAGQLAVAVEALVVHFHHPDVVEAGEDVLQARRQRVQMLEDAARRRCRPPARARSTASRIGPRVEPQPTSSTLPSGGP